MRVPNYEVVREAVAGVPEGSLVIRDCGPWDRFPTVTNGAEEVVEELVEDGLLPEGRRLFYFDSEGDLDEIVVRGGRFAGFAPGPGRGPA